MKKSLTITTFECDACGKTQEKQNGFPYEQGWTYIYNLQYKTQEKEQQAFKDKHFCSKEHLLEFINKKLNEEIKPQRWKE